MKPTIFGCGNFLKADDVKSGDLFKITNEGEEYTNKKFTYPKFTQKGEPHPFADQPKQEFHIGIETQTGEKLTFRMNGTSYKEIAKSWGFDTKEWIGRLVKAEVNRLPNGNKMILLMPLE